MKKALLMVAIAGMALVGCTKENPTQESRIQFQTPIVTPATKAGTFDIIENTEYPTDWNFVVSAKWYNGEQTFAGTGWEAGSAYINAETVAYDAAQKGWASQYYWPKGGGTLTFQAFSPAGQAGTIGTTGVKFDNYTVNMAGEQVDLMYSTRTADQTKANQIEQAYGYNLGDDTDANDIEYYGVQIPFKHALSRICFTAKQKAAYTGTTIAIQEIKLNGLYTNASFNQNLVDAEVTGAAEAWTLPTPEGAKSSSYDVVATDQTLAWDDVEDKAIVTEYTNFSNLLVLPQDFTSNNDATITVKYTIQTGENAPIAQEAEVKLNTLLYYADDNTHDGVADNDTDLGKKFEIGKQYTFNLIFALDRIYFAPKVENWKYVVVEANI